MQSDSIPAPAPTRPFLRSTLSQAILLACITVGGGATAPLAAAQEPQQTQAVRQYEIPAGTLDQVLNRFAASAGILLAIDGGLTEGRTSSGLSGSYGVQQGLDAILSGSGLQAVPQANGGYRLQVRQEAGTLAPVRVVDSTLADGSAALGYRSSAVSQVGPWQGRELDDLPYSITVLPRELIENIGGSSPDQMYRVNPTTQLGRSQHENDQPGVRMRGFNIQASLRDGLPSDQYNHANTLEDTERVEILSGLSGFLYGPGNVGGSINHVTKRPTAERFNRINLRNNGGENFHVHGDFGGPIDPEGRFGYRVNAAYQDGETAVDGMKLRMNFISAAFDWKVTDDLLLQVDFADRDYYNLGAQTYWGVANGATRPSAKDIDNTRTWGQHWTRRHYENTRYGAHLRWEAAPWLTLRAGWLENQGERMQSSSNNAFQPDGTFTQTVSGLHAPGVRPTLSIQEDSRAQLFADLRFDTGSISHQVTAGVQYSENIQKRYRNNPPTLTTLTGVWLEDGPVYVGRPSVVPIDRGERYVTGDTTNETLTIGDDIRINEQWSLLAGLSHSTIETQTYDESALTPTLSLIWKPLSNVTTYASYMESLEQGGVAAEMFNGAEVVNAGEVMDPMISEQMELGVKVSLGGVLLTTALFQIDKALQFYDITNPAAPVYVQDGRQVHRGIEFTAFGRVGERWSIVGGLTLLDTEIREQKQTPELEGKRPTQAAEQLIKLRAEYDTPWLPGLTLVAGFNYTSDQYVDAMNTDALSSFTLYDAGARYVTALAGKPVTMRFEAQNLSDKRYWANGGHVGDPRVFTFSVSMDL